MKLISTDPGLQKLRASAAASGSRLARNGGQQTPNIHKAKIMDSRSRNSAMKVDPKSMIIQNTQFAKNINLETGSVVPKMPQM